MRLVAVAAGALALVAPAVAQELSGGRALTAQAHVSPSTHFFADTVTATVDVVVDPRGFDPDRIRVVPSFRPYEAVGGVRQTRRRAGGLVHVRYEATLRCLHAGCLAPRRQTTLGAQEEGRAERHTIALPPVHVLLREAGERETILLTRHFPALQVVSRINTAPAQGDARRGSFAASLEPPAPTWRIRPELLAGLSLAAAALLALVPATLLGRALFARWRSARRWRPLPPLERALALVDWSARRDDGEEDRRKALESLAVVLDERGERELAAAARRTAWATDAPAAERTGALGREARETVGKANGRPA